MRVLMSALPSLGHVNPLLGMARALQDAGHEVRLATAPGMAAHIRDAGVTPLNMGFDLDRPGDQLTPRLNERLARWLQDAFDFWVDDLLEHATGWPPDVLMRDWSEAAGVIVARRLGIPSAVLGVTMRPPMDHLTESGCWPGFDYDELRDPTRVFDDLLLNLYPPSLAAPGAPPLDHEHYIRPPSYDGAAQAPPAWIRELGDSPLIYATMGTFYSRLPGAIEAFVEAAAGVDAKVLVTLGRGRQPDEFEPPPNVRIERFVPQGLVIPYCSAVICQGAFTSMVPALAHGVPVGCIPLTWSPLGYGDAQRCEQVGAGLTYPVDDESAPGIASFGRLDPRRVRAMMVALLEDSAYRQAAGQLRPEIDSLPDVRHAVKLVESLADRTGVP